MYEKKAHRELNNISDGLCTFILLTHITPGELLGNFCVKKDLVVCLIKNVRQLYTYSRY